MTLDREVREVAKKKSETTEEPKKKTTRTKSSSTVKKRKSRSPNETENDVIASEPVMR